MAKITRRPENPYLAGNFAPVSQTRALTPCPHTGTIPSDLAGGQYVRNGGNPIESKELGRDVHWFDGDGMLSGVLFRRTSPTSQQIVPEFVNQFVQTDVYLNATGNENLKRRVVPSIATLIGGSFFAICWSIVRGFILAFISRLPGSPFVIKKMSVANTAVVYHDGRALATCESGPPMRFQLPGLETVGWFNGRKAENEPIVSKESGFGGDGLLSFFKEWTTGHPKVDPVTKEFISFHASTSAPFVEYSVIPPESPASPKTPSQPKFNLPVPGIKSPKMMHDFGVSRQHTIIMDLPLSLNPFKMLAGLPVVSYDKTENSRFGVFPRHHPEKVQWFETNPCVIFHTANSWDIESEDPKEGPSVCLVACRHTSAAIVYETAALEIKETGPVPEDLYEDEQTRLYYFRFGMELPGSTLQPTIRSQWGLSAIPFEFPVLSPEREMREARYIYCCSSTRSASFTAGLGKVVKITCLAKVDVQTLIKRGEDDPPEEVKGCVDNRPMEEVLQSTDPDDPIKLFAFPDGWYAQEARFVPRLGGASEDDGWLLTYVFDESQLLASGECAENAVSELWIIDALSMKDIVARIKLPQRVPYGLHGAWFSEDEIAGQRPVDGFRSVSPKEEALKTNHGLLWHIRDFLEKRLG